MRISPRKRKSYRPGIGRRRISVQIDVDVTEEAVTPFGQRAKLHAPRLDSRLSSAVAAFVSNLAYDVSVAAVQYRVAKVWITDEFEGGSFEPAIKGA